MKHIKLFESHNHTGSAWATNERIKECLEDYFLELLDEGYRASFSHNHDYSITVFNLHKNKIDFDFDSLNCVNILQSDTQQILSIQKRLLNFKIENIISKVKFHVYTYLGAYGKSTLEPGLIEYSSVLNGDVIIKDIKSKITELKMEAEEIEKPLHRPSILQYYFDIQIQQEIDYGTKDASSVLFKNSL